MNASEIAEGQAPEDGDRVAWLTSRERVVGFVQMLQADPARTWQEVLLSGDVGVRGLTCVGTLVRGWSVTLALRDAAGRLHLMTAHDNIALGCPIASLFSAEWGAYWRDESVMDARTSEQVRAIETHIEAIESFFGSSRSAHRVLVRGNANFAHVELSVCTAIERVIDLAAEGGWRPSGVHLGERHPLGDPDELYPELDGVSHVRTASQDIGGGFRASHDALIPVALGVKNKKPLMRVSGPVRKRLRDFVPVADRAEGPADVSKAVRAAGHDKVLWFSVRGLGRRALPLVETIDLAERLALALTAEWERPAIVVDGTSLQVGDSLETDMAGFSIGRHVEVEKLMGALIAERIALKAPGCLTYQAVGLPLWQSFQLVQDVDGYVVHDGTTQHKIGWLRPDLPGLVHGPRQRNVGQGYIWHPVDSGTPAVYFPPGSIVDHKPDSVVVPHANYGYSVQFDQQLSDFVEHFVRSLGDPDPGRAMYERFYAG